MKAKSILLTLGHNSSAIAINPNHEIICGYEEERLTGIKSDSSFPINAIKKITSQCDIDRPDFYVSHWFNTSRLVDCKWYDQEYMSTEFGGSAIKTLRPEFSHHDAHAYSAVWFAGEEYCKKAKKLIVADGFGNFGETFSVYSMINGEPKIALRSFNLEKSLGLFYQYTTSYLGLKENQDEYKLLGYESHIQEVCKELSIVPNHFDEKIIERATWQAKNWSDNLFKSFNDNISDLVDIETLGKTKKNVWRILDNFVSSCESFCGRMFNEFQKRVVVSRFVQNYVESCLGYFISENDDVILAGGLFYNVKLNSYIADKCQSICVMPLAGDQGAALGLYKYHNPEFEFPGHLYWGLRDTKNIQSAVEKACIKNVIVTSPKDTAEVVAAMINAGKIVNVLRGSMEFGPRALCNTTTFAIPTMENVEYINKVNGRNTIMPMAPIVREDCAKELMNGTEKVHNSLKYMICTRECTDLGNTFIGATHKYPESNRRSMRPQIVSKGSFGYEVLDKLGLSCLINTSYNVHGQPIIFGVDAIFFAIRVHNDIDTENKIVTVIEGE